jgi:SSS family solute:Na+ symporter
MATKDAKTARKAVAVQLTIAAVVGITLGMVGFALLGYFDANSADLAHFDLKNDSDQMFAHFVSNLLPPVVSGLVLSGLFAAAMSSIDSGVNSITAVVRTDFIDRFRKEKISDRQQVVMARILALVVGLIVVMLSSFVDLVPGNFTSVTNKTVNLLTVPIFCLFFFALFFKKATPLGVWIGALFGTTTAVLIAFSGPFFGFVGEEKDLDPISFQWIAPTTLVVNIGVGCLVSWLDRKFRKIGAAKQPV